MAIGIMKRNQATYYGPGESTYPALGSVGLGEQITALWAENSWTYIEYSITGGLKRGYVPSNTINITSGSVMTITLTPTGKTTSASAPTSTGPGTNYAPAGSVSAHESITAFNYVPGNYTFIEYNVPGGKKRAYIVTSFISTGSGSGLELQLGQVLAGFNNSSCYGAANCNGVFSKPNCTWYCWGRAKEKTGKSLSFNGSANGFEWYAHVNTSNITKRSAASGPVANSVASFSGGSGGYGHVLYIEGVENGYTYFTEYNFNSPDAILCKTPTSGFASFRSGFTLNGFIVL